MSKLSADQFQPKPQTYGCDGCYFRTCAIDECQSGIVHELDIVHGPCYIGERHIYVKKPVCAEVDTDNTTGDRRKMKPVYKLLVSIFLAIGIYGVPAVIVAEEKWSNHIPTWEFIYITAALVSGYIFFSYWMLEWFFGKNNQEDKQ